MDSEYYKKLFIQQTNIIKKIHCTSIGNELDVLTDFHSNGSYESIAKYFVLKDNKDFAYMVRTTDLENENYENNVKYITKSCYEYLNKSKVYGGEVLINKIGCPGLTFLMPYLNRPVSLGMNLFMLNMKQNSAINNVFLYLFLNSKIGKSLTSREVNGTVPLTIDKESIKSILVPVFGQNFQSLLIQILKKREEFFILSRKSYVQAEDILNKELNITNVENSKNYSIKSLSESFVKSKRLDAEYYQDKYDSFEKAIRNYHNGYSTLNNFFKNISDKCSKNLPEYSYVEIGDINVETGDASYNIIKTKELPENAKVMAQKGDILVSTVRPNRGAIAILQDAFLVSGAFTVLRSNGAYSSQTLQVLLRNKIYKEWLLKFNVGTSYPVIKDADILNLEIPLIPIDLQYQISQKVQESFKLRKQSKDLLNKAVKAVDIAIEKSEEDAIKWLKENTNEYFTNDKLK